MDVLISKEQEEVMEKAISHYGITTQSIVAMEECSELTQAISKLLRTPENGENWEYNIEHLTEEMADVIICIHLLKKMYNIDEVEIQKWIDYKFARCDGRIDSEIYKKMQKE